MLGVTSNQFPQTSGHDPQLLSSRTRAEIFRLLFGLSDKELHLREIARRSGLAVGTVRGELKKLRGLDLLLARRDGNRLYYSPNRNHPVYPDIHKLVVKTSGLADVLRARLAKSDTVVAFIFGSLADSREKAESDVDLLLLGSVTLRTIASRLGGIADEVGREINPHVLTPEEYRRRRREGDHFLDRVIGSQKIFVVGTPDDLEALA